MARSCILREAICQVSYRPIARLQRVFIVGPSRFLSAHRASQFICFIVGARQGARVVKSVVLIAIGVDGRARGRLRASSKLNRTLSAGECE